MGNDNEPDRDARMAEAFASMHQLTRLEVASARCPLSFPPALRRLRLDSVPGDDEAQVAVIDRIGELTLLTHLELARCGVDVNLAPLASLANLETFGFAGNSRASLAPLATLTRLTSLDLAGMYLSDHSGHGVHSVRVPDGLATLTTLRALNMSEIHLLEGWDDVVAALHPSTVYDATGTTMAPSDGWTTV